MKYRKKPVVVEAIKFTEENKNQVFNALNGQLSADYEDGKPIIKVMTIHGETAIVRLNDWIISEPKIGFYYPIKPDIFEATYEKENEHLKTHAQADKVFVDVLSKQVKSLRSTIKQLGEALKAIDDQRGFLLESMSDPQLHEAMDIVREALANSIVKEILGDKDAI